MSVVTPTSAKPVTIVVNMREQSIARDAQCRADLVRLRSPRSGDVTARRLAAIRCLPKTLYILAPLTLSTTSVSNVPAAEGELFMAHRPFAVKGDAIQWAEEQRKDAERGWVDE